MAILPSAIERTNYGVDTLERAMVWAFLGLFSIYKELSVELANRVSIDYELEFINLSTSVGVNNGYETSGLNFVEYLQSVSNETPVFSVVGIPSSTTDHLIPPDPTFVQDSLEKYLVWICSLLENTLKGNTTSGQALIRFDAANRQIICSAKIPYDRKIYLESRNIINAIELIIPKLPTSGSSTGGGSNINNVSFLADNVLLGDNFFLGD